MIMGFGLGLGSNGDYHINMDNLTWSVAAVYYVHGYGRNIMITFRNCASI